MTLDDRVKQTLGDLLLANLKLSQAVEDLQRALSQIHNASPDPPPNP